MAFLTSRSVSKRILFVLGVDPTARDAGEGGGSDLVSQNTPFVVLCARLVAVHVPSLHILVLMYVPCQILLQQFSLGTRPHKVERTIMSQLWLRMVWPWQNQSDQFQCLCCMVTKCKVTW